MVVAMVSWSLLLRIIGLPYCRIYQVQGEKKLQLRCLITKIV
jgi:hypothetical protein